MTRISITIIALACGAACSDDDPTKQPMNWNLALTADDSPPYQCRGNMYLQGDNFPEPDATSQESALLTVSVLCRNPSNGTPSFKFVMSPDDIVALMRGDEVLDPMPGLSIEYRDHDGQLVSRMMPSIRRAEGKTFKLQLTLGPILRPSGDSNDEGVSMTVEGKWYFGCSERGEVPTAQEEAYTTPWCQSTMTELELWDIVNE